MLPGEACSEEFRRGAARRMRIICQAGFSSRHAGAGRPVMPRCIYILDSAANTLRLLSEFIIKPTEETERERERERERG